MPTTSTFRRRVGATSLIALWLVLLASNFVDPVDENDSRATQLRAAATHLGRLRTTAVLELLTAAILPIAVFTLVRLIRGRGATLANIGGALGTVGLALIGAHHLFLAGLANGNPAQMEAALSRTDHGTPWVLPLFFAAPLAIVALVSALARARLAPRWVFATTAAFFVLDLVPGVPGGQAIPMLLGLTAYTWIARHIALIDNRSENTQPIASPTAVAQTETAA